MSESKSVIVGKVGACYGIRGWLKINSYTEQAETIFDYSPWFLKVGQKLVEYKVQDYKKHNQSWICKLDQVNDRNSAQLLVNLEILVDPNLFPKLDGDQIYWRDLEGMHVITVEGYDLGVVTEMMETGSNDVMIVAANVNDAYGQKERLIPFVDGQVIKSIDRDAQRVEVDWDPGF